MANAGTPARTRALEWRASAKERNTGFTPVLQRSASKVCADGLNRGLSRRPSHAGQEQDTCAYRLPGVLVVRTVTKIGGHRHITQDVVQRSEQFIQRVLGNIGIYAAVPQQMRTQSLLPVN